MRKLRKLSTKEVSTFYKVLHSFWKIYRSCFFKLQNWYNLNAKHFLLEPLLSLGLGYVENVVVKNYLRRFPPETPQVFVRKLTTVCTNWKNAIWQTSITFHQSILEKSLSVGGVDQCGLVEDFDFQRRQHWQRFLLQPVRFKYVFSNIWWRKLWFFG